MKIAILLRLNYTAQRNRLIGIFNAITPKDDWDLRILQSEGELRSVLVAREHRPDGIIAYSPREDETRRLIACSDIPIAIMGIDRFLQQRRRTKAVFVANDNQDVGRLAAEHLLSLGNFKSFAYVPYRVNRPWSVVRGESFSEAVAKTGRSCRLYQGAGELEEDLPRLRQFIAELGKPAAVFTANDERAQEILQAAKQAKVKVPDQLAVLGVDDDELFCEHATPPLSSVRTNTTRQGFEAARGLKRLLGGKRTATRSVKVPIVGITERASTRPISPATHLINRALLYIRGEFHNDITPANVAEHLGVSKALLFLRFRQYAKSTVSEAIRDARLKEAKRLIRDTDRKINKIFRDVGFKSAIHATRLFKRKTGLTPREFRRT